MTKTEKVTIILELLREHYGPTKCYLDHENAWQLLIATMLSAQCTDARVNLVTKDLFKKYTSVKDFAQADLAELEQDIHSTGFYHNKAKNIIACCQKLLQDYNGEVPSDIEQLTALAGVGRKTANVVRGNWYHIPSVVVDTHVKRVSNLLGLTKNEDPVKIEFDLMQLVPKDQYPDDCTRQENLHCTQTEMSGVLSAALLYRRQGVRKRETEKREKGIINIGRTQRHKTEA